MQFHYEIIKVLADGKFHSGAQLGKQFNVSRTTIWNAISRLKEGGIDIHAISGKGYKLSQPIELLDSSKILQAIDTDTRVYISDLEVFLNIASTNSYLLNKLKMSDSHGRVCFAEQQSAGRGRRGRHWVSPFGGNIFLSLLWKFADGPQSLSGLSLVVALAVVRALRKIGLTDLNVKWPNDIYCAERKVAGILLEMTGETSGPCNVVIGIGVNVVMPRSVRIDQPWIDISSRLSKGSEVKRNYLAGQLLEALLTVVNRYQVGGLEPFMSEWHQYDHLIGRPVILQLPNQSITGVATGIDPLGSLKLLTEDGITRHYASGETSLRKA